MKFFTKLQLPPEPLTRGYRPRSTFSLSSVLNWICWTKPPSPRKNSSVRHCYSCHAAVVSHSISSPQHHGYYIL